VAPQPVKFQNVAALAICILLMAASLYFQRVPELVSRISFASLALIFLFSLHRRHIMPLLLLILVIKLLQLPISYFLKNLDTALVYYLCSALIDLLMAFCIVHYHNDRTLLKLCRSHDSGYVPQVYLMALLLAVSSLIACLQAMEYVIYTMDPEFYGKSMPWIYEHQRVIKQTLKTLFELSIWSLLLDPNRWKILQKIQNKFLTP
jgi:ABC-type Fe3+-siderophore transport system permease subunit